MQNKVFRCFVEKKDNFELESASLYNDFTTFLGVKLDKLRVFNCYDVENIISSDWESIKNTVLSEPMSDIVYDHVLPETTAKILCYEALPGQFDQRADSCGQCIQMLVGGQRPLVRYVRVLALENISDEDYQKLEAYVINPVECQATTLDKPETLIKNYEQPKAVPVLFGFVDLTNENLFKLKTEYSLAMDDDDLLFLQKHFISDKREPTLTELKVIDTYWSDHCRHTTFGTIIDSCEIHDERVKNAYGLYIQSKGKKPITLMDIATCAMKSLRNSGKLPNLDESEEINACTVKVKADIDGNFEDWLLLFKNETHNHPTEIEPFGGAATCIGGAIRDPLSGRSYVYQAMRVTGSGDPRHSIKDTIEGKLPQRKISTTAAAGYSSYGNQIGLATGQVTEIYHEGYKAKRLEIGAVVGAAPAENVVRIVPQAGDVIVLLGGRTGRDGIGGATGSSKTHDSKSVETCSAEVQKGNAPEERKIQRLFRKKEVTKLIKRCNDFGAGGVCVAIGELADGLSINLDKVPKKYDGLSGTELAISESQERMAVVVDAQNVDKLLEQAALENIEATAVAVVTEQARLVMQFNGQIIVDLDRVFLNSNGAEKHTEVYVPEYKAYTPTFEGDTLAEKVLTLMSDINFCSQKGLVERFDGSIGASSVLMPHGGKYTLTPSQVMAATLPKKGCKTASVMSFGFDVMHSEADPFGGSVAAVVSSVAKLVAAGVDYKQSYLTLQEYFPRLKDVPSRWGVPFAALLGAYWAQMKLEVAAIGGKDSMSGSFNELDVPPTLVSFAIAPHEAKNVLSSEFKAVGRPVYLFEAPIENNGLPNFVKLREMWEKFHEYCNQGKISAAWSAEKGGAIGGIIKMSFGNKIGFISQEENSELLDIPVGSIIAEAISELDGQRILGYTQEKPELQFGRTFCPIASLLDAWTIPLETIFPTKTVAYDLKVNTVPEIKFSTRAIKPIHLLNTQPKVVIPAFPGTNCEIDTQNAFEIAGAKTETILIRNLNANMLNDSIEALAYAIDNAQMIAIPGGFSGGDEPDGSGKYIVSVFRHPKITQAVRNLLQKRGGLMLGICNGFQALIKLGLVTYGDIVIPMSQDAPTVTFNVIGRHISKYVTTKVTSVKSPWLAKCELGQLHSIPVSHGEGRFVASEQMLNQLNENGQIAFQYANENGVPLLTSDVTPNGSAWAIEGITSPDGRILGKMGHSERRGEVVGKNIYGDKWQPIFESGIEYFK